MNTFKKKLRKKNSRKKKGGEVPPSLTESLTGTDSSLTGTDTSIGPLTGIDLGRNTNDYINEIIKSTNEREMTLMKRFKRFLKKILETIKNFGRYNGGKRKTLKRKNTRQKKRLQYKKK